jgi:hypothetical protein
MPTYQITAPDGRVFEVTPPEGTNPSMDEVLAKVRESYSSTTPAAEPVQAPDLSKEPVLRAPTVRDDITLSKIGANPVGYDPLRLGALKDWAGKAGGTIAGVVSDFYDKYLTAMTPDEIEEKNYRPDRVGAGQFLGEMAVDPTTYIGTGGVLRRLAGAAPDVAAARTVLPKKAPLPLPGKVMGQKALPPGPVTSAPDAPMGRPGGAGPGRPERVFVAGEQTAYDPVRMEGIAPPRIVDRPEDVTALLEKAHARRQPLSQSESNSLTLDAAQRRPLDLGTAGNTRRIERLVDQEGSGPLVRTEPYQDYDVLSLGDEIQANKPPGSNDILPRTGNTASEVRTYGGGSPPEPRFVPRSTPPPVPDNYKVEKNFGLDASKRRTTPPTGQEPDATGFWPKVAAAETHLDIPRIAGATPMEIAKTSGSKAAEELVHKTINSKELSRVLESDMLTPVVNAYQGITREGEKRIGRFLDGGPSTGMSQQEQAAAQSLRKLFNAIADSVGMEHNLRVTDYFPRLREVLRVEGRKMVAVGQDEIPVYLQEIIPKNIYKEFFERGRSLDAPADRLDAAPVIAYVRAAARRLANGGGRHPITGEQIPGLINDIAGDISRVPEELVPYYSRYINDNLGHRAGKHDEWLSPRAVGRLRQMEYLRTMAYNPVAWIQNAGQNVLTFATSRPDDFVASFRSALPGSSTKQLMKQHGVIDPMPKDVHKFVRAHDPNWLDAKMGNLTDRGGQPFTKIEEGNRAVAFGTGIREAERKAGPAGLSDAEKVAAGRAKTRQTQFVYGAENAPESFRQPLSKNPVASVVGASVQQFKPYMNNYVQFMKDIVVADAKSLVTGWKDVAKYASQGDAIGALDSLPGAKTAKYLVAGTGIFGTDAMFAGGDKRLSELLTGDRNALTMKGILPALGIAIGNAIGLGATPEDFRSLMFMLPGPALAQFLDIVSGTASIVSGHNYDFSLDSMATGKFGKNNEITNVDQQAEKLYRSIPIAGIAVNRLRHALMQFRTEGNDVRTPLNWSQASGMEGMGPQNPIKRRGQGGEVLRQAMGVQAPGTREISQARGETAELRTETQQVQQEIIRLMIGGKTQEAAELMKKYPLAIPTAEGFKSGALKTAVPPEILQYLELQKTLKGRGSEIYGDVLRRGEQ